MRYLRKRNWITLIALIVTIVILLILVGIAIMQLNNNGLLKNTKISKEKYTNSQKNENSIIDDYSNQIENFTIGIGNERQTSEDFKNKYQRLRSDKYIDVDITQKFTAPTDGYLIVSSNVSDNKTSSFEFH